MRVIFTLNAKIWLIIHHVMNVSIMSLPLNLMQNDDE